MVKILVILVLATSTLAFDFPGQDAQDPPAFPPFPSGLPPAAPPRFLIRPAPVTATVDQRSGSEEDFSAIEDLDPLDPLVEIFGLGCDTCDAPKQCIDNLCRELCPDSVICGDNAVCEIIAKSASCFCPSGFVANDNKDCIKDEGLSTEEIQDLIGVNNAEDIRDKVTATGQGANAIQEFSATMNDFTQSIMTEMWNEEGPNFVFSPFSLHTALAILTTGSTENSKTENELLDALGRVRNIQALEMRYQKLLKEYQTTDVNTLLSFGTKLWTAKRYFDNIRGSFLEKLSAIYDIEFSLIKTKNPERDINRWVREITHGKIDKIVDSVGPDVAFMIVNALYFNASWTIVFDEVPNPMEFQLSNGDDVVLTKMMTRTSFHFVAAKFDTELLRGIQFTAVAIPYQFEQERFEMIIVMPDNPRGLTFLEHSLKTSQNDPSAENLFDIAYEALEPQRNTRTEHVVTMPPFTIDSKISVTKYLQRLGINAAFDSGEFDRIVPNEPFKVGNVLHRAKIEVTRDGTVGAAASAIEVVSLSGFFESPKIIEINKPFIFFIHDRQQRVILFAGKYTTPNR